jgi:hypothetical protein
MEMGTAGVPQWKEIREMKDRLWLLVTFGALIAAAFLTMGRAHADPYCGPGMNYDWRHDICQGGAPVPL